MKIKFTETRLWLSVILLFLYIFIADLYVDYIISREVDGFLQMAATVVFLVITFYSMKGVFLLWTKNNVKQSKKEEK